MARRTARAHHGVSGAEVETQILPQWEATRRRLLFCKRCAIGLRLLPSLPGCGGVAAGQTRARGWRQGAEKQADAREVEL